MDATSLLQYMEKHQENSIEELNTELELLRDKRLELMLRLSMGEITELVAQSEIANFNLKARAIILMQKQRLIILKFAGY